MVNYIHFRPKFTPKEQKFSSIREKFKVVYAENGNKEFVKVGSTDMYEVAQSHKDACLIENIIRRATNDPSVLRRTVGSYFDLTEAPTNMFDAMKVMQDAKETFENMPQGSKDAYNNSFDDFLGTFKTATGLAKFIAVKKAESAALAKSEEKKVVVTE